MKTILITGGTGMIGRALTAALLEAGHRVIIFTRNPAQYKATGNCSYAAWDPAKGTIDEAAIQSGHAILHLAGAGVADKRWSEKRKKEIRDSRVQGGELLCKALSTISNEISVVVSASAIGWYGPDPQVPNPKPFEETAPAHDDFLGPTCEAWEQSLAPLTAMGKRVVFLRTGIVLATQGGALAEFMKPVKFGIAAILSNGKQMISWLHIQDMVRMYLEAMENEQWQGAYNAVAPHPISNKELVLELAKKMRGKAFIPIHVPGIFLKIGLGEMSVEVLKSTTVSADKIRKAGFQFAFPTIEAALQQLLK
ncbi:TIGR01777 family oxidoreductase [Flavihumibacter cheonanensis]|uniref:TIGR01777 family oxidoreductase n=1 Tax=Flavihumibacter cheonanensis TaxID=1442385 RepID=UPI001EF95E0E|nr:TIGR01777 family oxidoreductase [Flavihumibacter cheonanensis]MCG7753550.1 TIGR01777 family oxidoreductase [Flavihumibacter cheonanensis]